VACRRSETPSPSFYILALATLVPYRRLGVASALLNWATAHAASLGLPEISLHVRASDEAATQFYLRRGFTVRAHIPHYYPMAEDSEALLLTKSI
jgi:ribosomal protein S18 acetylase RimI-like enzyme